MTQTFSFNLVDEPWIPCMRPDGTITEFNLREAFAQAHQLTSLAGDSPPITAALHRFLLAILHRVFGPEDEDAWAALWAAEKWDMDALNDYLNEWHPRFDLFDPEQPFYQARDERVRVKSTISLSHDRASGNNPTLFDHHTEIGGETLTPAQAARVLIAGQAYGLAGLSGIKQKFTDGTCAGGIIFLVEGENFKQTLLLNMIKYPPRNDHFEVHTSSDAPAWEMDNPFTPARMYPLGYLDYLTWQNRRVLFQPERTAKGMIVRKMTMGPALRYAPVLLDPMKNYREGNNQVPFFALSFRENRVFWQDSASLFAFRPGMEGKARPPATFRWLRWLIDEVGLPGKHDTYRTLAVGMSKKQAKVFFYRQEQLPLPLVYLTNANLVEKLDTALGITGAVSFDLMQAARLMGMHLQDAMVGEKWQQQWARLNANTRNSINAWMAHTGMERNYWASLNLPFHAFIVALAQNEDKALGDWYAQLRKSAHSAFQQAVGSVGNDARSFKAVVKGENYLHYRLNQVLPSPSPPDESGV